MVPFLIGVIVVLVLLVVFLLWVVGDFLKNLTR